MFFIEKTYCSCKRRKKDDSLTFIHHSYIFLLFDIVSICKFGLLTCTGMRKINTTALLNTSIFFAMFLLILLQEYISR